MADPKTSPEMVLEIILVFMRAHVASSAARRKVGFLKAVRQFADALAVDPTPLRHDGRRAAAKPEAVAWFKEHFPELIE